MWNNNQQALTELNNGQFVLQNEPNYQQQINLPRSVQVANTEVFTALYWMGRWSLQCIVQQEPYFTPSWNALSEGNFENQSYARLVGRMCDAVLSQNIQQSQVHDAVVMPMLEMDVAVRWCDVPQQAQQILSHDYQQRAMKWKQDAERLLQSTQQQGGGFGQQNQQPQSNGFNQQQQGQQSQGWGGQSRPQQSQGGFSPRATTNFNQQAPSGTNKSGFFGEQKQAPSSRNAAGIRTTTSAVEKSLTPITDTPVETNTFSSRASGGWGGKSTQESDKAMSTAPKFNPLEDMLPQSEQWKIDDVIIPGSDTPVEEGNLMTHSVSVAGALTAGSNGISVDEIGCPVLREIAKLRYGNYLPLGMQITGRNNENNILVVANGQTDIPVRINNDDDFKSKLGYDNDVTVLMDYIMADYDNETITGKTVPVKKEGIDMEYFEHTLNGPVSATNVKHHVEYASIVTPTTKVNESGLITKHGKQIDSSKVAYTSSEAANVVAANIKVQTSKADKSIETFNKVVVPFVTGKDFSLVTLVDMFETAPTDFAKYHTSLESLPRDMQLYVSYSILSDVRFALANVLQVGINVGEFDDIADMHTWLIENRSNELADKWLEVLSHIMRNNIRIVPDTMRVMALECLGDSIPKDTDHLVLLERETYSLTLPYTLSELNITAANEKLFFVQDASHAKLHNVMAEVFTRLVKTNISDFQLRLADGCVYRICKLATVAKTYTFSKLK
jgi:hypothetical protein